jgi:hypothetical protein
MYFSEESLVKKAGINSCFSILKGLATAQLGLLQLNHLNRLNESNGSGSDSNSGSNDVIQGCLENQDNNDCQQGPQ